MSSKQVTDRQKNAASVLAAEEAHVAPAAGEIAKALSPFLKAGEELPDAALLAALAGRMLAKREEELVAADSAHEAELGDDEEPRRARNEAAAALYDEVTQTREWLRGFFGVGALRGLGFSGETPEDPVVLARFAGQVIDALGKPLPAARQKGATWDPAQTVKSLVEKRDALQVHLADVAREQREAQLTWAARESAMDGFDRDYQRALALIEGLLRFGGQDALADRLRPATRKAAKSAQGAEPAAPPAAPAVPGRLPPPG
jgi:hypothetical protein